MAKGIEKQMTKAKDEEAKQSEEASKSQPSSDTGGASTQISEVTNQMGDMNVNDGSGAADN